MLASKQWSYSPSPKVPILDQVLPPLTAVVWNETALVPTELSPNVLEGIYGQVDRARVLGRVRSTEYSEARDSKPKARSAGWLAGAKGAEGNEMQACLGRGKAACRSLNGILSRGRATRVFDRGWYL